MGGLGDNMHVKYEMSSPPNAASMYGGNLVSTPAPQPFSNPAMAAMRAAQHIQEFARDEKVPPEIVNASIEDVMKRAGLEDKNGDGMGAGGLMLPGGGRIAQVDGQGPAVEENLSTADVDRLLELHILKQRSQPSPDRSSDQTDPEQSSITPNISMKRSRKSNQITFTIMQADGPMDSDSDDDDDEDDDEDLGLGSTSAARRKTAADDSDAINSDLDDSEDEFNSVDDDDGEESGMLMLCLYDKVTRTKNKWKCVLKDGVVNVNGKDYLFGKGNGEYEW